MSAAAQKPLGLWTERLMSTGQGLLEACDALFRARPVYRFKNDEATGVTVTLSIKEWKQLEYALRRARGGK